MGAPTRLVLLQRPDRSLESITARLRAWGWDAHACATGQEMMAVLRSAEIDLIIIDAGVENSGRMVNYLKSDLHTRAVPVIAAAIEDPGLVAAHALALGADDVLILPVEDAELYARLRALSRLAAMEAERRRREEVLARFGVTLPGESPGVPALDRLGILLIGPAGQEQVQVMTALGGAAAVAYAETAERALERLRRQDLDVALVTGARNQNDLQRLCAAVRSDAGLFDLPVMLIARPDAYPDRSLPFHWGVSDVLFHPFHPEILRLRVQTWVRQQRLRRRLRRSLAGEAPPPTTDRLTHLFSHAFLHSYLEHVIAQARHTGSPVAVASFSVVRMTQINREYGFVAGDHLLAHLAAILARHSRAEDLPARMGDDRFCLVLNGVAGQEGQQAAERIAGIMTQMPLTLGKQQGVRVSMRTGVAELDRDDDAISLVARAFERVHVFDLRRAS